MHPLGPGDPLSGGCWAPLTGPAGRGRMCSRGGAGWLGLTGSGAAAGRTACGDDGPVVAGPGWMSVAAADGTTWVPLTGATGGAGATGVSLTGRDGGALSDPVAVPLPDPGAGVVPVAARGGPDGRGRP